MKVVINNQYGGFGLSWAGAKAYATKKGRELFRYRAERIAVGTGSMKVPDDEPDGFCDYYLFTDLGEQATREELNAAEWLHNSDIPRHDPDLVAVVEELGAAANGDYATLKVVEIPDDMDYVIEEYDGNEWIAETHRTWG